MAKPPTLGARGSTAVPKTTNTRKKVAMNSSKIACIVETSIETDWPPRREPATTTSGNNPRSAYAASTAAKIWAMR